MAGGSHFIWIPLLLFCIFGASDNRYVHPDDLTFIKSSGNPEVDKILANIPVKLPEGIDPRNVNVTTITIKTCAGLEDQLLSLNRQLQQTLVLNNQLGDEAFGLRREVRQLKTQLTACNMIVTTFSSSYKTELHNQVKELLGRFDGDTFLILKIITLTSEVKTLEKRTHRDSNSSVTATELRLLLRNLEEKITELNATKKQLESHTNLAPILQIISLQNDMWDFEQEDLGRGESSLLHQRKFKALEEQLEREINNMKSRGDVNSAMLELMYVNSKIAVLQKLISAQMEKSRTEVADYQRQIKQKGDLIKKNILMLNNDEGNTELSKEILALQADIIQLKHLLLNAQRTSIPGFTDLRTRLKEEKKRQANLQNQLAEIDYNQSQLIINMITAMKEMRQQPIDEQRPTTQVTSLQDLLQAKERVIAKARADIKELERQLRSKTCSGIEERYKQVETELKQKITALNRTGDSRAALILNVINLHDELRKLKYLISITQDPQRKIELQRQLEEKQEDLHSKNVEVERLIANPKIILTIIELQNQIWELHNEGSNEAVSERLKELQSRVDGLISELDDKGNENTKLMLKITTLQTQVEHLEKQLSDLQGSLTTQVTQLSVDLTNKKNELQGYINELHERNQTNARLALTITNLQTKLRNLENERRKDNTDSSLTITELKDQLHAIKVILSRDEAEVKTLKSMLQAEKRVHSLTQNHVKDLERQLQLTTNKCSGIEERYKQVETELEQKITALNRTGDSRAALILNVINLHDELRKLKYLISITQDPQRKIELQRQLEEKQEDLHSKNVEVERLIANPKIILTIIELQNQIWELHNEGSNEAVSERLKELQSSVDGLISELDDKGNENTKLMLKITTLQTQVEHLEKQLSDLQGSLTTQVTQLSVDLTNKKNELQGYINELHERNQTNARLALTITNLQTKLRNLENERRKDNTDSSLTITELKDQLHAIKVILSRDEAEVKTLKSMLQAEKRVHSLTQNHVKDLERQLQLTTNKCSGIEERYKQVETELEQKIAALNRTGDSRAALILNVINLHDELRTLKYLISTSENPERTAELQRQLDKKQAELNSKDTEIERLIGNPKIILNIIELQNEIWDLQSKGINSTTNDRVKVLQTRVDGLISDISDRDNDNTKLMLRIMMLQNQVEQLEKQLSNLQMVKNTHVAFVSELEKDLNTKRNELQRYVNELNEKNQENGRLILSITNLTKQLKQLQEEKQKEVQTNSASITKLREQLKAKEEEHARDQDRIKALENTLNQTEAQCSNNERKITELQNDLDEQMRKLQSESDSVTTLALRISVLTQQLKDLQKQLENTDSKVKIAALQAQIEEKNKELAKITEELKTRSPQPQRLLDIITIQTEILKYVNVPSNETSSHRIKALEDELNDLIEGIEDEKDENTKLVFQIFNYRDTIARLKKQAETQNQHYLEEIKDRENELGDIRNEIREKTKMMELSDTRIANLSANILELHQKIEPLEDEISHLKQIHAQNIAELQKTLNLKKRQLQDSESRLKDVNVKYFNSVMEVADLRAKLRDAQTQASKVFEKTIKELKDQLEAQQRDNKKIENTNKDLQQEVKQLKKCCNDNNIHCADLQRQLQQSHEDADRLQQQLDEKSAAFKQLERDLNQQTRENNRLQNEYNNLERQIKQANVENLQQQLHEKDVAYNQQQEELDRQRAKYNKLQNDYNNLQSERYNQEDIIQDLQSQLKHVDDKKIHTSRMTLDPNTAHPRVLLSADNTEISTVDNAQNIPDNPGRYDVTLAVLGKSGFSGGRHYWEVSVAGKNCFHIGMASASAPRKGSIAFSPSIGFWTIVLTKQGVYKAINVRSVVLQINVQPHTLGILLDYKKGQISFYDVGSRAHLYSFTGQRFTDKIYPFVNFCVEDGPQTPIVLLTPGTVDWIQ